MISRGLLPYTGVVAFLTAVCGLGLLGGGIWLAFLGGSLFYGLSGIALIGIAALIFRHSILALWLAAATIVITMVWTLSQWWLV